MKSKVDGTIGDESGFAIIEYFYYPKPGEKTNSLVYAKPEHENEGVCVHKTRVQSIELFIRHKNKVRVVTIDPSMIRSIAKELDKITKEEATLPIDDDLPY